MTFCTCMKKPEQNAIHSPFCFLLPAIEVLDDIVDWSVMETYRAINGEEEPRGVVTVELPEEESRGGADGRGPVEVSPPGEG